MAISNRTAAFKRVQYVVNATGDTWFQPNISDKTDYAADKVAAVAQCQLLAPEGEELVG